MIVSADLFSETMTINSITFFLAPGGFHDEVTFDEYYVDMGYCSSEYLGANYDDNYINGWKYRVFERTSPFTFYASDPTIYFDTPFFYIPANGNLVFEIGWPNGEDEFYTFSSVSAGVSCVYGNYSWETGDQYMETPHLMINGAWALEQITFAGIKASFQ